MRKGHRLLYFPCLIENGSEKEQRFHPSPSMQQKYFLSPLSTWLDREKVNFTEINVGKPQA